MVRSRFVHGSFTVHSRSVHGSLTVHSPEEVRFGSASAGPGAGGGGPSVAVCHTAAHAACRSEPPTADETSTPVRHGPRTTLDADVAASRRSHTYWERRCRSSRRRRRRRRCWWWCCHCCQVGQPAWEVPPPRLETEQHVRSVPQVKCDG